MLAGQLRVPLHDVRHERRSFLVVAPRPVFLRGKALQQGAKALRTLELVACVLSVVAIPRSRRGCVDG
jgi:hypothetical protein